MNVQELVKAVIENNYGWAVADQFNSSYEEDNFERLNGNALTYIKQSIESLLRSNLLNEDAEAEVEWYYIKLKKYLEGEQ